MFPPSWPTFPKAAVNAESEEEEEDDYWMSDEDEAIKLVVEAWPEALQDVDKEGRTMLHRAYEYCLSDELIGLFQKTLPEMNDAKDIFGFLPHHCMSAFRLRSALYSEQWAEFLVILEKNPESAFVRFSTYVHHLKSSPPTGHTATDTMLHLIVRRWCDRKQKIPYAIFQSLLSKCPDLVKVHNGSCGLPLTVALARDADAETIFELLRMYPEGANVPNKWKQLPIERALKRDDGTVEVLAAVSKASTKLPLDESQAVMLLTMAVKREPYVHEAVLAILKSLPEVVTKANEDGDYPLYALFERYGTLDVCGELVELYPDLLTLKDHNGKSVLHVAYENHAQAETIDKIISLRANLTSEKDLYGRLPKDMQLSASDDIFVPMRSCLLFVGDQGTDKFILPSRNDTSSEEKEDMENLVLPFKNYLMRDPSPDQKDDMIKWDTNFGVYFNDQLKAREILFRKLLDEFAELVKINDTRVIQRAATLQALAYPFLSKGNDTIIDLDSLTGEAYWYQQEVLKLVMRVYNEDQSAISDLETPPAIFSDGTVCVGALDKSELPPPSKGRVQSFGSLFNWLMDGISKDEYSVAGPVQKSLQSLFNKLYIRRGQTKMKIIGDTTRATLFIDDKETLAKVKQRIESHFPNIVPGKLQNADKLGVVGFMEYIHEQPQIPGTGIIPYRFKPNSSQKKENADNPLWFNLNFFDVIPEYHRSGNSDIFVAFELQIGLTEEIKKHRKSHVAYERYRILDGQPCLKNFIEASEKVVQNQVDQAVIDNVLEGTIARSILSNEQRVVFNHEHTDEGEVEIEVEPRRLCLNNKQFNMMRTQVLAGPFKLDPSKVYYVHSLSCDINAQFKGSAVGLYAHFGPYRVEVASGTTAILDHGVDPYVMRQMGRFHAWVGKNVVKPGNNYAYFERECPIPPGSTAVELVGTGYRGKCENMELVLKQFDLQETSV